ncbi:ATP-binding protein [Streptomyces sp. NPDC001848]|uniref:ATP-binding protein n=1 Tax=Streptomyces sp. NPDC001848 TaxID=3364618 RepID=UPI0036A3ACAF
MNITQTTPGWVAERVRDACFEPAALTLCHGVEESRALPRSRPCESSTPRCPTSSAATVGKRPCRDRNEPLGQPFCLNTHDTVPRVEQRGDGIRGAGTASSADRGDHFGIASFLTPSVNSRGRSVSWNIQLNGSVGLTATLAWEDRQREQGAQERQPPTHARAPIVNRTLSPDRESVFVEVPSSTDACRVISLADFGRAEQRAREAVRKTCAEFLGARLPDALLVVTELVANAVSHTAGVRGLMLRHDRNVTALTVFDKGGTTSWPRAAEADPLAESGRGLHLVAALADSWHARPALEGKAVTAVFRNGTREPESA